MFFMMALFWRRALLLSGDFFRIFETFDCRIPRSPLRKTVHHKLRSNANRSISSFGIGPPSPRFEL